MFKANHKYKLILKQIIAQGWASEVHIKWVELLSFAGIISNLTKMMDGLSSPHLLNALSSVGLFYYSIFLFGSTWVRIFLPHLLLIYIYIYIYIYISCQSVLPIYLLYYVSFGNCSYINSITWKIKAFLLKLLAFVWFYFLIFN